MPFHYLKTAWRSFLARKLHTLVNVLGLALGLTCLLGAHVFVHYVESADRHFPNADRIHIVFQGSRIEALALHVPVMERSSTRLEEQLRIDLPELEATARMTATRERVVSTDAGRSFRRVRHAQPSFLDIFELNFRYGSGDAVAGQARSAILTEQAALAMFGIADVVGQSIRVSNGQPIEIGGVISAIPEPSHLGVSILSEVFEVLVVSAIPEETGGSARTLGGLGTAAAWLDPTVYTYVLLPRDGRLTIEELNEYLAGLGPRFVDRADGSIEFDARPVSDIAAEAVNGLFWNDYPISVIGMILLLSAMVLAIACANFVNLATAAVTARTREAAVRKIAGASPVQIVLQHLLEALLTAAAALILAIIAMELALPAINAAMQRNFSIPWSFEFGWFAISVVVVCGLLTGSYPALLLSRVRPTQALHMSGWSAGSRLTRTVLITAQFAAASFLAIVMLVVQSQNGVLRDAGLRLDEDAFVVLRDTPDDVGLDADVLRSALLRSPEILDVTGANSLPWALMVGGTAYSRSPDPAFRPVFTQQRGVTFDYFEVFGLDLLAGTSFTVRQQAGLNAAPESYERLEAVILDQAAAEQFGWPNPADAVGQVLYAGRGTGSEPPLPMEVIGVVERPPFEVLGWGFDAFAFELNPRRLAYPIIRIASGDAGPALAHIDAVWRELAPHSPIRREFVDARFRQLYALFEMANRGVHCVGRIRAPRCGNGIVRHRSFRHRSATARGRDAQGIGRFGGPGCTSLPARLLQAGDHCERACVALCVRRVDVLPQYIRAARRTGTGALPGKPAPDGSGCVGSGGEPGRHSGNNPAGSGAAERIAPVSANQLPVAGMIPLFDKAPRSIATSGGSGCGNQRCDNPVAKSRRQDSKLQNLEMGQPFRHGRN